MKLATTMLFAAVSGALGCSHSQPPQAARATPASTLPMRNAVVATAEPANPPLTPGAATIPKDQLAPPRAPAAKPADERPIATSPGFASPRPDALPPVAMDPVRDQPETGDDQESVREIRALLAADKSLSETARQITIVARKGRIRLSGQVNTAEERAAVERAARKAANVIDVKNQLVVLE